MRIVDPHSLVPNPGLLEAVVRKHPFSPYMIQMIDEVVVEESEQQGFAREHIRSDLPNRKVVLGLGTESSQKEEFEYILYHEFGHVADRLDLSFGYSEDLKAQLTKNERGSVMELWNVYIDSRLNRAGLFCIGHQPDCFSMIDGKKFWLPKGVEGEILGHIAMMEGFGVPHRRADGIVRPIWENPPEQLPYPEMIPLVRGDGG